MNIGIVTAYNDMLSAHQPYGRYPEQIKLWPRAKGATAQVAGGVPAMCDGVTQGQDGHGAVAVQPRCDRHEHRHRLSHAMFEGALLLGICDKIVPGLLIGALRFGHLPMILCRPGRCPRALPTRKSRRSASFMPRARWGARNCSKARARSYHGAGTCTFYGTANSNQMMMETDGAAHAGSSLCNPGTKLRQELTRAATHRLTEIGWEGDDYRPFGRVRR
jgi:phosphogluconate dehydratase